MPPTGSHPNLPSIAKISSSEMKCAVLLRRSLLFLTLACSSVGIGAADEDSNRGVFADWSDFRSRLYDDGVSLHLGYVSEVAYNAQGGDTHLTRHADQVTMSGSFDLDKLLGLPGSTFQATITERHGRSLSADAKLGTLLEVQEIYGGGETWRWTQFWYSGSFLQGAVNLKLGRMTVGEDFMSFSCSFQNLSFCGALPGYIVSAWYDWPVSTWAARIKLNFGQQFYLEAGAYQVNPAYLQTNNAFKLNNPPGRTGTLMPAEFGWTPKFGNASLPGAYRAGVWYDKSDQPDVYFAADGTPLAFRAGLQPLIRHHEVGGYAMLQQQLTAAHGNAQRGLTVFANFVKANRETATIDQLIDLGFFYTGPFNARPRDELGFAVGRTRANSRAAALQWQGGMPTPRGSEFPMEVYYSVVATPWLTLRPNVQVIEHPGGLDTAPTAVVFGLKTNIHF